jgi:hypothetical protein
MYQLEGFGDTDLEHRHFVREIKLVMSGCTCCDGSGGLTPARVYVLRLRVVLVTAFRRDDDGPYCG